MNGGFELPLGIDIPDITGLQNGYEQSADGITAVLSAENILPFVDKLCSAMSEPIFFFIELPCSEEEEKALRKSSSDPFHYRLYYLDNCTKPVVEAIIKSYGSLLVNDGLCRFGFGENAGGSEVYVQSYKVMSVYAARQSLADKAAELLHGLGAKRHEPNTLVTPWELLSPQNPGTCMRAEEEGMTVFDIPALLEDAGMYFAEIV